MSILPGGRVGGEPVTHGRQARGQGTPGTGRLGVCPPIMEGMGYRRLVEGQVVAWQAEVRVGDRWGRLGGGMEGVPVEVGWGRR